MEGKFMVSSEMTYSMAAAGRASNKNDPINLKAR